LQSLLVKDLFLLLLGVAWLLILWPAAVRAHRNTPLWTAARFKRRMSFIAPKAARAGRWILTPQTSAVRRRPARGSTTFTVRRRKQRFVALLLAAPLTAVAGLRWGGNVWFGHLGADATLIAYMAFLVGAKRKRRAAQRIRALSERRRNPEIDFTDPLYGQRRA
jgi:hypothetical protein